MMDASDMPDLVREDVEGQKSGSLKVQSAIEKTSPQDMRRICMYKVFDVASRSFSKFGAKAKAHWPACYLSGKDANLTDSDATRPLKGGWRTAPLIFGTEICEKIATSGLHANLVTYLVQQLHLQTVEAANTITNFNGSANLSPIFGAYLADAYLGRFRAIVIGSIFYLVGVVLLAVDAAVASLKPPPCAHYIHGALGQHCLPASFRQKAFLYMAFAFLVFGAGGIRPCVAAFGADQFDQNDPEERKKSSKFFNWYYFSLGLSLLFAVTVLVYIQDNVGWSLGFGIPAILMTLSLTCFVCGYKLYRHAVGNGNPFIRLAQVCVSAFRQRKHKVPVDPSELFRGFGEDGSDGAFLPLKHSDQFRFLDKAAIVTDSTRTGESNRWKLCTVHQVEEFKCLLRILPIWGTGILFTTAHAQQSTFMVQQARTMDRHIGSRFQVPPASFTVFSFLTLLVWVPFYDRIIVPATRRLTGKERGITFLQRIGIGLFISVIAMLIAGATERYRRYAAMTAGLADLPHVQVPISAFWLVPQYCLLGLAESFVLIGQLELFYDQFPENMRSLAGALFSSSHAVGSYSSTIIVELIQKFSEKSGNERQPNGSLHGHQGGWFSNNLNRGHLDYFYWLLGSLGAINFVAFLLCARWYKYKNLH
ncbi:hypothetical protein O6H91_09G114300 [Diphasiastrum complanatum]|uniref:Uncharacterized protein n=4 Tax=Diphasiastrum complanatum TaxID=34168 RepID=A0ACC2CTK0_DIPCM|nr:hypothetical protein O6H91_09G114300 [Diphasiastrum complanatum]KAJ7545306.1 hypothetical protein O6H91_09G114300 [Diphasiastrum complanatum]KAJ7545307.1 hypothetical protein O6H91_09G114300 [Diphasiastrum complanatum]KAJ7545309.1 hypothetical protein O6H91_09G114300 [Diphasiastrum complanatum]